VHFTTDLDRLVTTRRIEAAWKHARRAGIQRAQPNDPGYADAKAIEDYMMLRLDDRPHVGEIVGLNLRQLAMLSTDF
jgi:hypothetical protein